MFDGELKQIMEFINDENFEDSELNQQEYDADGGDEVE